MLPGSVGNNHTVVPRRCDAIMCPVEHVHNNYNSDCLGNREARTAYRAAPHPVRQFAALSEAAVASSGGRVKVRVRTSLNPDFLHAHSSRADSSCAGSSSFPRTHVLRGRAGLQRVLDLRRGIVEQERPQVPPPPSLPSSLPYCGSA